MRQPVDEVSPKCGKGKHKNALMKEVVEAIYKDAPEGYGWADKHIQPLIDEGRARITEIEKGADWATSSREQKTAKKKEVIKEIVERAKAKLTGGGWADSLLQVFGQAGNAAELTQGVPGLGTASNVLQGIDFANQLREATGATLKNMAERAAPGASNNAVLKQNFGWLGFGKMRGGMDAAAPPPPPPPPSPPRNQVGHRAAGPPPAPRRAPRPQRPVQPVNPAVGQRLFFHDPHATRPSTPVQALESKSEPPSPTLSVKKGKGKNVVMSKKDYLHEHHKLIALLNEMSVKAKAEANKQKAEVKREVKKGRGRPKKCVNNIEGGCGMCGGTKGEFKL